eukprot:620411-Pyramimonas_sp.AAC.1
MPLGAPSPLGRIWRSSWGTARTPSPCVVSCCAASTLCAPSSQGIDASGCLCGMWCVKSSDGPPI